MSNQVTERTSLPVRILYIGLAPDTIRSLNTSTTKVVGVSYLDFLLKPSLNPADILFNVAYGCRLRHLTPFDYIFYFTFKCMSGLAGRVRKRYAAHLWFLIRNRVSIIDIDNQRKILAFIRKKRVELIVVNAWSLLSNEIITAPRLGALNIHPSKLPSYRGALPTLWALKNGDTSSAVTIMKLDTGVDAGTIISQVGFEIEPSDDSITIEEKIQDVLNENLSEIVQQYVAGLITPTPQLGEGSTTDKYGSYRKIGFKREPARDIVNKVRLYPYLEPNLYCYGLLAGRKIFIRNLLHTPPTHQLISGHYKRKGLQLMIGARERCVTARLFKDMTFMQSLFFLLKPAGEFDE